MKVPVVVGCVALCTSAIFLGQLNATAGGKKGGGVAGGSTTCATAPDAILGSNAFDTSASSVTVAIPSGAPCGAHSIYKSNYFNFIAPTSASYTFATCDGSTWDTRLALLATCSLSGTILACNDDSCAFQSQMVAVLVAGTSYKIVVGGYGSSNGGAGTLVISETGSGGGGGGGGGGLGADVIVGSIPNVSQYGSVVVSGQTIMAYAFGTTSCNIGTAQLEWFASPDSRHPFIPMNAYRLKNGRFEQIGMGWGKHGFTALQQSLCGTCSSSGTGTYLGVGCSDPYSSGLNGGQSGLGTRTEVNAANGVFPGTPNSGMPSAAATIGRRVQINGNDLNPALNVGAVYVTEAHYIHAQDAAGGNDDNNASWRSFTVGALSSGAYAMTLTGPTNQQRPAIDAWKTLVPAVTLTNADVQDDGRFILGHHVTDNGNGTWRYEYAVQNLNSNRSGRSFSIPVPAGVTVTGIGFKDINYHSGDAYDPTDWTMSSSGGAITWTGGTYATSVNGNALRFSTTYNFYFTASGAPTKGAATLGLFKPGLAGAPNSVTIATAVPSAPAGNPADLNNDGTVNATDLATLLGNWAGTGLGDINGDGMIDAADLSMLLGAWG